MKKQLLAGLVAFGAVSMLCGFDSAETVDSISEKMQAAIEECAGFTTSIDMNVDASVALDDGSETSSIDVAAAASFDADYIIDPLMSAKLEGTISYSVLGNGDEITMEEYILPDESGTLKAYTHMVNATSGDDEWASADMEGLTVDKLASLAEQSSMSFSDLSALGIDFALAPDAYDVDGAECYLLAASIDANSIKTMLNTVSEMAGKDLSALGDIDTALTYIGGLKLDIEYYINAETFLPEYIHMDMNDSDLSTINMIINTLLGSAGSADAPATTASLVINDVSIDLVPVYGDAPEIVLPAEAANAQEISLDDVTSAAGSIVG